MIDVIVPSFKDERIVRTILSVKASKHSHLMRLIVIDGGSGDDFINSIKPYLETEDIVVSEKDQGIFDALNKGLDLATSEFIFWLGSDDFINPSFDFQGVVDRLKNEEVAGVIGKTHYFNTNGLSRPLYYSKVSLRSYKVGVHVPHFSSIWRRDVIGDLRFDLSYRIASDYDFFFQLMKSIGSKQVLTDDDCLTYMQEGGNSSRSVPQRLKGTRELFDIHVSHTNWFSGVLFLVLRYGRKITLRFRKRSFTGVHIISDLTNVLLVTSRKSMASEELQDTELASIK